MVAPPEGPELRVALSSVIETYLAQPQVDLAKSTQKHIRAHVKKFRGWCEAHYPRVEYLDGVTRGVAHEYADWLRAQPIKGKTYNNHRGSLGTVWETLKYRAGLDENVWHMVPTANEKDSQRRRPFTAEESERVLEAAKAADPEWYGMCLFALYTAMRQGDIARLQWFQVDQDPLVIVPNKTTRHTIRAVIPLHSKLKEYVAETKRPTPWLFPTVRRRHETGHASEDFTPILKAAGVKGDREIVDFHSFRHTWRTRFAAAGGSPEDAKTVGGWGSDEMAAHYNHDLSRARAAIEAMP